MDHYSYMKIVNYYKHADGGASSKMFSLLRFNGYALGNETNRIERRISDIYHPELTHRSGLGNRQTQDPMHTGALQYYKEAVLKKDGLL